MDYAVLENRVYLLNRADEGGIISFAYSLNNKVSDVQLFSYDSLRVFDVWGIELNFDGGLI
jgi:hypothetical protein